MAKLKFKKIQKNDIPPVNALNDVTSGEEAKATNDTPKQEDYSLKDIMDTTRDCSFFYSGVEYGAYLEACYNSGIRNFLMSYHYLSGRNLRDIFDKYPDIHLMVDSGAFTFQTDPKFEEYTIEDWEKHIEKYLRWAEKHKEHIFAIANLDIEVLVGAETVKKWNKQYFEPFMAETKVPVCFVYHEGFSSDNWEYYCKRYPYVGFTSADTHKEFNLDNCIDMLRTAEKHGALVHGFGVTRIRELAQLPFYTVDSTTWKAGMMYGRLIIFNGKKTQQIDKVDWEKKAFPLIKNYPIDVDFQKLDEYNEPEVIKVNVYAFKQAEEYVIKCIKHLQYWQKLKAVKVDIDNLPPDFFPSAEWVLSNEKNTKEVITYAKKMNINPERDDMSEVAYTVMDMTAFLNWDNPKYESLHSLYLNENIDTLDNLHDKYINKMTPDDGDKVRELIQFYKECLSGERDTLLVEGTNFDRIVKERDEYVDDTEYEKVELSRENIIEKLGGYLPDGETAPEIDELDDEIFGEMDIVPIRDKKTGKLIKGSQLVKSKTKNIYSKKFPKFACDTCLAAAKCPEYKAGYVCAYHKLFSGFDTRNANDIIQAMQGMVNHNISRMQKAMLLETINGTVDADVTALIDQNTKLLQNLMKMYDSRSATVVRQTRTMQADGTVNETMQVSNPQGGGILEKLFANMHSKSEDKSSDEDVIEVESKEVTEPDEVVTLDFDE